MLTIITELPDHVFGVRASQEVSAEDLKAVLIPGLENLVEKHGAINYLLVLDTSVKNWTAGAWLQDMKAGIQHFTKWKKIAVVTEEPSVEKFTDLFSIAVPGKAKGFSHAELEEAKRWVSEDEEV